MSNPKAAHWLKVAGERGGDAALQSAALEVEIMADEIEQLKSAGWRACIDHIIRPDSPCPVCEIERLRDAMVRAQKETGTSTSTWHVLEDALRGTTKDSDDCPGYLPNPDWMQDGNACGRCGCGPEEHETEQPTKPTIQESDDDALIDLGGGASHAVEPEQSND